MLCGIHLILVTSSLLAIKNRCIRYTCFALPNVYLLPANFPSKKTGVSDRPLLCHPSHICYQLISGYRKQAYQTQLLCGNHLVLVTKPYPDIGNRCIRYTCFVLHNLSSRTCYQPSNDAHLVRRSNSEYRCVSVYIYIYI